MSLFDLSAIPVGDAIAPVDYEKIRSADLEQFVAGLTPFRAGGLRVVA